MVLFLVYSVDPFTRKEWYDIKAPTVFPITQVGKTLVSKTQGTKLSRDSLINRVFEVSLGDLKPNGEEDAYRKFRLKVDEISGHNLLTNFYGMDLSSDKVRSLVRKWHSLIETFVDVKTSDNYLIRLFVIGFTKRRSNQIRKTSYAQTAQIKKIRAIMRQVVTRECSIELIDLVRKFIPEVIGKEIEKATERIYPLQNVLIRKVKILKAPKLDVNKLLQIHGGAEQAGAQAATTAGLQTDTGAEVERA